MGWQESEQLRKNSERVLKFDSRKRTFAMWLNAKGVHDEREKERRALAMAIEDMNPENSVFVSSDMREYRGTHKPEGDK